MEFLTEMDPISAVKKGLHPQPNFKKIKKIANKMFLFDRKDNLPINGIFYLCMTQPVMEIKLCEDLQPLLKMFPFDTSENIVYGLMSLHRESCIKAESTKLQSKAMTKWGYIVSGDSLEYTIMIADYRKKQDTTMRVKDKNQQRAVQETRQRAEDLFLADRMPQVAEIFFITLWNLSENFDFGPQLQPLIKKYEFGSTREIMHTVMILHRKGIRKHEKIQGEYRGQYWDSRITENEAKKENEAWIDKNYSEHTKKEECFQFTYPKDIEWQLRNELSQKDDKIRNLSSSNITIKNLLASCQYEKEALETKFQRLDKEYTKLEGKLEGRLEEQQKNQGQLKASEDELRRQIQKNFENEKKELEKKLKAEIEKNKSLNTDLRNKNDEIESLLIDIQAKEDNEKILTDYKERLSKKERRNASLFNQSKENEQKIFRLSSKIQDMEEETETLRQSIARKEEEIRALISQKKESE